ncbi:hypothetical protein FACS189426_10020 [Bacteroidia bacterium]|nr:hypothetical protein FACS189426_10020 [Bacteroidia bacterium]GHV70935.1 hypothetical protein FACS189420_4070 [Bacteroidia bacterium]
MKNILHTQTLTEKQELEILGEIIGKYAAFDMDSTIVYASKMINLAHKLKEYKTEVEVGYHLGAAWCFKGDYDRALSYFNNSLEIAVKQKDKILEIGALTMLAFNYVKQGKYNTSIDYYLKSLKLNEQDDVWANEPEKEKKWRIDNEIKILTNLGEIYRKLNNPDMAILYLDKAAEAMAFSTHLIRMSHIYIEYAENYLKQGDMDKALEYALKSDSINTIVQYRITNNHQTQCLLASIYLQLNDYDQALQHANEAMAEADILTDNNLRLNAWKILSSIYLAMKRYPEAEAEALKAWQTDSTNIDESRTIAHNIALANIYMHNPDKAALYLQKYSELNDQYSEKSFHTTVSDLAVKYETEKKEFRIAALEDERTLYVFLSVTGGALFLSLLFLFIFQYRLAVSKQKLAGQRIIQLEQEKQIIAIQSVIDGETEERKRLARDLHDGLGGMLSIVKLNLNDVEHLQNAREMLDQSISELRRIAQDTIPKPLLLYGLKVSLENFCMSVPNAEFHYFGDDSRLDSRIEIAIYRCGHELVNNAIKHSGAENINVQLVQDINRVSLTVQDNGCGFDTKTPAKGIGLKNLRDRITAYNGKLNIYSTPGKGTEVYVEITPFIQPPAFCH